MYERLTKIDDLTRPDHTFLTPNDECFYLGEYTARGGYACSSTNDLINNLKKPMGRRSKPAEWKWKGRAIDTAASELRRILGPVGVADATFVPAPPSKIKSNPDYDDRLLQILTKMGAGLDPDIREIVTQHADMAASHEGERASIEDLISNYRVDSALLGQPRNVVVVFDDVLTTGRHFAALKYVLSRAMPGNRIVGLFIARRMPKTITPEELAAIFGLG